MNFLAPIGRIFLAYLATVGHVGIFPANALTHCVLPPLYLRHIGRQMISIGYFSLPVVGMTALVTGMVLALQIYIGSSRFDAAGAFATIVVMGITRERGPVLGGLVVAGRGQAAAAARSGPRCVAEAGGCGIERVGIGPLLERLKLALVRHDDVRGVVQSAVGEADGLRAGGLAVVGAFVEPHHLRLHGAAVE